MGQIDPLNFAHAKAVMPDKGTSAKKGHLVEGGAILPAKKSGRTHVWLQMTRDNLETIYLCKLIGSSDYLEVYVWRNTSHSEKILRL